MAQPKRTVASRVNPAERAIRDQEVVRAQRDLAAYFKGRRTEREARAALKIIKAFVREREGLDPKNRPPLPGARPAVEPGPKRRRSTRRKRRSRGPESIAVIQPPAGDGPVPPETTE
jgi:hypothetical protein